ncbi:helix-turn-helix transcriptional regulator [Streptomyces sp. TRM66268-LWL]|uniref:Helix-turn-helix transcriptional regulator n=1 Tax=Streptomyces polyasparticus TaxID=2767826 RepID=A0ABR7SIV0_9ACTN|nr:helix-turn-helix domain-containing protein [Streptomyces polyasparticus]MBC9714774.1 helix-turn-helix transcriptional regulator [Streptomyces polyasparticus]
MPSKKVTDVRALDAYAHPLRIRLDRALITAQTATATQLAEMVNEPVSLVSYHLRKLAEYGYIEEAPQGRDGRERWWRPAAEVFDMHWKDFSDDPEGVAAYVGAGHQIVRARMHNLLQYVGQQANWPHEWASSAFGSGRLLKLTHEELQEMAEEAAAFADRWAARSRAAQESDDGRDREHVELQMYGYPFKP